MALSVGSLLHLLLPLFLLAPVALGADAATFTRSSFPPDFVFGTASASYQYEGAWNEDGKGPSIWDVYTHNHPERIADQSNGDVAVDLYHRYKEDVKLLKSYNMDAFRFSISWARILPTGSLSGGINKKGVEFYNNLINELLANGLKPFVTIFHWDSPQGLENKYGGFLSPRIVDDYRDYAEVLFKYFGDRVKHWTTFNEPYSFCSRAYAMGIFAPGRCSPWVGNCTAGNSGTEPYAACHHILLAHAAAVKVYKEKYQASQKGSIGITLVTNWFKPYSSSKPADIAAQQRALDFMFGWFMDPLAHGNYPASMRMIVGNRLPRFTKQQSELVKGSYDFIGINYYTTWYAQSVPPSNDLNTSYTTDSQTNQSVTGVRNGVKIGPNASSDWLFIYPPGIRNLMLYIKNKYNNPAIFITENGMDEKGNKTLTPKDAIKDDVRVVFYYEHLRYLSSAIQKGANVKGYFAWSFMDDFEWDAGFTARFGLTYVDRNDNLKRYPKKSALWVRNFLKK